MPEDAIPAIRNLFESRQVIGLGDGVHGTLEGAARLNAVEPNG